MPLAGDARSARLRRLMLLAVATAAVTIAMKVVAWLITGSVGILSDAAESVVNLAAALLGLAAVIWASRPEDEEHAYGHEKANYLSAGMEGGLILFAAASILYAAVGRLLDPADLESIDVGIGVIALASVINLIVGRILIRSGADLDSMALEADGKHLMTDVWTSAGVIAGVGAVAVTGWQALDPIVAILVAANIIRVGVALVTDAASSLMDRALERDERAAIDKTLESFRSQGAEFHAVRTRRAGQRVFISMHLLVPGNWTVQQGHDLSEQIEEALRVSFAQATIFTHLEPMEDPASFLDTGLDRH